MPGTPSPYVALQFFTNAGAPAAGYYLHTFAAGTTTALATYTDVALAVANANPIVLDAAGRCTIFLTPGLSYHYQLALSTDTTPPASPIWTRDNISTVPPGNTSSDTDVAGTAGETLALGEAVYLSDGAGGTTTGRWYKTDADNTYSSTAAQLIGFATAAITTGAAGTIRTEGRVTGLSGLTAGTLYYISATAGALTSTGPTNARAVLQADGTTTGVIIGGHVDASATLGGVVSIGTQTLAGAKTVSSLFTATAGVAFATGSILDFAYARCTSALTKNANITPANITGLAFAVAASDVWAFWFVLKGVSAAAADWRFAITGPAAPTAVWYGVTHTDGVTVATGTAFATDIFSTGFGIDNLTFISGLLRNGANAGTVQLQMAQWTSDASDSIVRAESFVVAIQTA